MSNIIVKNTTAFARTGHVTVGVPLTRAFDLRFAAEVLVVNNAKVGVTNLKAQWDFQGNRYDNGAAKYIRVTFEVDLQANEEKTVVLTRLPGSATATELSYAPNLNILGNISGTVVELSIDGVIHSFPMLDLLLGSNSISANGDKDFYHRQKIFTHMPATSDDRRRYLWADIVIDIPARLDQVNFFIRYGYYRDFPESVSNKPEPVFSLSQNITLRVIGPRTKIRWEEYKVPSIQTISPTHKVYTLVDRAQPGQGQFVAGSSNVYKGVFCYGNTTTDSAELEDPILAMAEDWKLDEHYPCSGVMPAYPSYVTSESNAFSRSETLRAHMESGVKNPSYRSPYNWSGMANRPDTTGTGDHGLRDYAYGMRGMPWMRTVNYNWIPFLEFTTRQEGLRHFWYYNTNGDPVPPSEFLNNGILIFHSRYFWTGSAGGFSRHTQTSDFARPVFLAESIYGPERQHYTLKIMVLQSLISMDWYGLEFMKMSVVNWINNNRSDTSNAFINTWEASRAAGRMYENAGFLYEATYDQVLKSFVEQNLTSNLYNGATNPSTANLNKTAFPGGVEVLRRATDNVPSVQGAGLGPLRHWRPWEESAVSLGFFFLAKAILRSEPNNSTGLKILEIARDVSASLVQAGNYDLSPTSNRRVIAVSFPTSTQKYAFQAALGSLPNVIQVTGMTSGATGVMYLHHHEEEVSQNNQHRIFVTNASGSFQIGETITTSVGATATITRKWNYLGRKSYVETAPTNGIYRSLTEAELNELTLQNSNFPLSRYPMGYLKYHVLYKVYSSLVMSGPSVVKEAGSYYGVDEALVSAAADTLITEFAVDTDNGDFDESTSRFYGYMDPNFGGASTKFVLPATLTSDSTLPAPTVEVETNTVNATAMVVGSIPAINLRVGEVTTIGTVGSADVSILVPGISLTVTPSNVSVSADGTHAVVGTPPAITFDAADVFEVVAVQNFLGFTKNTFVLIGSPISASVFSFVHEPRPLSPGASEPTVFNYHKVIVLNTITLSDIITDYYLRSPENSVPGLLGEVIGFNGQSLGAQGYTWSLPGTTEYEAQTHIVVSPQATHRVSKAGRGGSIRDWSTTVGEGSPISWLKAESAVQGLIMNEVYTTNVDTSNVTYTPNFLGAFTSLIGSEYTFVSPNRLISSTLIEAGLVFEASVTPLEQFSSPFGGSGSQPAIAPFMKMYHNIAVETSIPGVTQIDFWAFHVHGIPSGNHNLSGNLKLDIHQMFNQMVIYDADTEQWSDVSSLLLNLDQEIRFGVNNTVIQSALVGADPVILPSNLTEGRGAIICADTTKPFVMGFVAGLDSSSDSLRNVTHLTFENFAVSLTSPGGHRIGISSIDNYNPGSVVSDPNGDPMGDGPEKELGEAKPTAESVLYKDGPTGQLVTSTRAPGWVGRRMYVVFGASYQEVFDAIRAIDIEAPIKSTIDSEGVHPYERPAII
jgi:hypothetical protein